MYPGRPSTFDKLAYANLESRSGGPRVSTHPYELERSGLTLTTYVEDVGASVPLSDSARRRIEEAPADNTTKAYTNQWQAFTKWCGAHGVPALPCPEGALDNYVSELMDLGRARNTIQQAISAIRSAHGVAGLEPPSTEGTARQMVSYGREQTQAETGEVRKARVLVPAEIRAVAEGCDPSMPSGLRDRAFILMEFRTGRRFAEIAALRMDDVVLDDRGLLYLIRKTKTDQTGDKAKWQRLFRNPVAVVCPVRALTDWLALLAERGITSGVIFRRVDRYGRIGGEPTSTGSSTEDGRITNQGANAIWRRALLRAHINPHGVSTHTARRSAMTAGHRAGRNLVELTDRMGYVRGSKTALGYIEAADSEDTDPLSGIL
jgi:integrase